MPPVLAALGSIGASVGVGTAATATAAATTAAVVGGTIITGAVVGGTLALQSNARRRAESQARLAEESIAESKKRSDEQIAALEKQQSLDASQKEDAAVRQTAREKQRRKAASASGRRSTILTSPIGVTGSGAETRKQVIGT